eukprot:Pgem_evm1s10310
MDYLNYLLIIVTIFGLFGVSNAKVTGDVVEYTFEIEEWVVDYLRPTVSIPKKSFFPWVKTSERVSPYQIADE